MKEALLQKQGRAFVWIGGYHTRHIPKEAGFLWNRFVPGRWSTRLPAIAAKLAEYADNACREELTDHHPEKAIEASRATRATTAHLDIPAPPKREYLPYQEAAIKYALNRENTLLGDEMGLGKTIEAIGVFNARPEIKTVLIICPASLRVNWQREWERWAVRDKEAEIVFPLNVPEANVLIVNYDILHKPAVAKELRSRNSGTWDLMIIDEAHYLKNPKALRTKLVLGSRRHSSLKAKQRLFLTGTPIPNRPIELYPLVSELAPEMFGNWKQYVVRYCSGRQQRIPVRGGGRRVVWKTDGASHLHELQAKLRSTVMVRRLKADVLRELPPKRRQVIELPVNALQELVQAEQERADYYEQKLDEARERVAQARETETWDDYREAVRELREGQATAISELAILRHETADAKVPSVVEHLRDIFEQSSDRKIVCFAHHKSVIQVIKDGFGDSAVILTGDTPMPVRQKAIDSFQTDPRIRLFIGQMKAAGLGITLTASSHVVFAELDWVPATITQAEDRCHRIGQADSVLVQHLVLEGSLDAYMARKIIAKQDRIDAALDKQPTTGTHPVETAQAATVDAPDHGR